MVLRLPRLVKPLSPATQVVTNLRDGHGGLGAVSVCWVAMIYRERAFWSVKGVVAGCWALLMLTGCESGTITGQEQTCRSSGGLFAVEEISCNGSVDGVRGSPHLTIVEADEELEGSYRLDATIAVARGTARANVTAADGEQVGGEVTPETPLQITAVVEPVDEEEIDLALKVAGKVVRDLRYEATLIRQD